MTTGTRKNSTVHVTLIEALITCSALCELGSVVSCSVVNKSAYSELFNVPVAVFGVLWHLAFLFMLAKARTAAFYWVTAIFVWCLAGVGFVIYLLYAEWILRTICPFCTIIHVLNLASMWYAWRLYTSQSIHASFFVVIYELRRWVFFWGIIFVVPVIMFNFPLGEEFPREHLDRCLYEKHAVMYGAPTCGFCQQQKRILGGSMEMVEFVDCSADGKAKCEERNVEQYPTWVIEHNGAEVKRLAGVLSIEKLLEFYECSAPQASPAA